MNLQRKKVAPLISILKTTRLSDELALILIKANVNEIINNSSLEPNEQNLLKFANPSNSSKSS